MSLNLEELASASDSWNKLDKRLKELIGFNPATSNHYGQIQLYNHRIGIGSSDDEILELRSSFVRWRTEIFNIFKGKGGALTDAEFGKLFSVDCMFGTLKFLKEPLDLNKGIDYYRKIVEDYISSQPYMNTEEYRTED